ncbi:MAG: DNA (cytosine-5-)-methyltransferase [Actinomycetota bacterium]|nr:DNA (cytosine-5-)-methyltransferase [Actinomycetota bacterium]
MHQPLYDHISPRLSDLELRMIRDIPPGGNWRHIPSGLSDRVNQIKRRSKKGIVHTTYYGRLRNDAPSYTINTYFSRIGNGCFLHPSQLRLISLREGARLQSFPDRVRFSGPRRAQYEQIGNAVPPLLGYAVGRTLPVGTVADLFAGAGGLSLGLEMAGMDVVYANDRSPHACATLSAAHGRDVAKVEDLSDPTRLRRVAKEILARAGGELDVLAAGPPCQSFSTAGGRDHTDDRASLLWVPFRIAEIVRPRVLIIENVQGILSSAKRTLPSRIEDEMRALGLTPHMCLLRAEEHGVPQRRTRVLFVGMANGREWTPPPPRFSKVSAQPSLFAQPPLTVEEAISDLPPLDPAGGLDEARMCAAPWSEYQAWIRGLVDVEEAFASRRARLAAAGLESASAVGARS